ncbi:hypothetical protein Tco_0242054 [Tanacetum coccineum]
MRELLVRRDFKELNQALNGKSISQEFENPWIWDSEAAVFRRIERNGEYLMEHKDKFNGLSIEIQKIIQEAEELRESEARARIQKIIIDDDLGFYAVHPNTIHTPEPDNFLSMGEEHLDTTLSVRYLVPIPRESEGLSTMKAWDSDSLMEEIDLFLASDDSMPPGIEDDDYDSEGDFRFLKELLSCSSSLPE